ncbi:Cyclic di-GMP phosphodiesterase response regulator RpfG [Pelotomaculum schinkii]|uniref:Cyclic di-GMP phosphodiesterase response regulator RpfG n=1 Tax=Pelotomaculum schinkii TaxID=78350 RepID=A0A4Y7R9X1_9FIRM|nr:HD domain-containing phosphohydrolase [Pelotomaculum schinkii]TEB05451.1 Cyclic di-GMP phosphodiesterase response regulator RpfG [Pelotomaculum schinkii]
MLNEINKLMIALNNYDFEIYCHSISVSYIACRIAYHLGLQDKDISIITNAALLHDIGKVKIDKSILSKKEQLTGREWSIIKRHPESGVVMLKPYSWAKELLVLILYHHERWDGKGYFGVEANDIPLGARIIAVADAFDAMRTSRPYKKGKAWDESLSEIEKNSGMQFDPYLTERLIRLAYLIF